ncbi:hypothetical protein [Alkaliphilus metalliredigens]
MNIIMAFTIILISLAIGDIVSTKTKAFVPSVFVTAVLFIIGFWTFFPQTIVDISSLGMPGALLAMYLLITHMGTMMSVKELVRQWKTITIGVAGIIGVVLGVMTIGRLFFGWDAAVIATPPLTGGIVASIMMSEAAAAKGLDDLSVLAILVYVAQGFIGYPITALCLKKEGTALIRKYRSGEMVWEPKVETVEVPEQKSKFRIIPPVPEKYNTTYVILMRLGLVAWAAVAFATATNEIISKFVICLLFGVIAAELGIVDRKPLNLSGSFGWLMTSLMAFVFAGLARATPEMVAKMAVPLFGIIIIGVIGMGIISIIVGRVLGVSKEMAFAIALTGLYGFPPNYILTDEATKALANTKEERDFLMDQMLPRMLVGGFTTVTVASVIIAGIFIKFI